MRYHQIGGLKVSILGLGAMRLPVGPDRKTVDEKETDGMIRFAVERGINYFDTAAPYHEGQGEAVLGNILSRGLRDKVLLTTKQPCWLVQKYEDFDTLLNDQLKKLKTDYLDFYLLHALFTERWEGVRALDVVGWLQTKKKQGKIRHFGFSFHDNLDVFKRIIDAYNAWEMCQIQYNYMDESFQAGTRGLEYAAARNIPVAVMEPLRGGLLASPPEKIRSIFDRAGLDPVETALRWLWDKPEVSLVLSGMSSMKQLEQNIGIAERAAPAHPPGRQLAAEQTAGAPCARRPATFHGLGAERAAFTAAEKEAVDQARAMYEKLAPIPCTQCRYCMPCPSGVFIPENLALFNKSVIFGNIDTGKIQYMYHTPDKNKASACTGCGACEDKCPQHIKISEWMPKIHTAFMQST